MRTLIIKLSGLPLLALALATGALAQGAPMQMPMEMTWGMIAFCLLLVIVLLLSAAALVKYLFFR